MHTVSSPPPRGCTVPLEGEMVEANSYVLAKYASLGGYRLTDIRLSLSCITDKCPGDQVRTSLCSGMAQSILTRQAVD